MKAVASAERVVKWTAAAEARVWATGSETKSGVACAAAKAKAVWPNIELEKKLAGATALYTASGANEPFRMGAKCVISTLSPVFGAGEYLKKILFARAFRRYFKEQHSSMLLLAKRAQWAKSLNFLKLDCTIVRISSQDLSK